MAHPLGRHRRRARHRGVRSRLVGAEHDGLEGEGGDAPDLDDESFQPASHRPLTEGQPSARSLRMGGALHLLWSFSSRVPSICKTKVRGVPFLCADEFVSPHKPVQEIQWTYQRNLHMIFSRALRFFHWTKVPRIFWSIVLLNSLLGTVQSAD